jgi:hypothetical protein
MNSHIRAPYQKCGLFSRPIGASGPEDMASPEPLAWVLSLNVQYLTKRDPASLQNIFLSPGIPL